MFNFFERGVKLLKRNGLLCYISSNRFLNSGFGEGLRSFLQQHTRLHLLIDFTETGVFTAITEPCIILVSRGGQPNEAVRLLKWNENDPLDQVPEKAATCFITLPQKEFRSDGWRLESPAVLRLLEKLRAAGKPLGQYVSGRFYYGIKTGLNEAFVVERATRDRLIAEHPSSAEVFKPFLRGRDVKRWRVEFADQYLIKIESSENKQHPWSGRPLSEAERIFAKTYPAIHAFFETMRDALIARYDQGKYFWELRACAYWQEFERPKIVIPAIEQTVSYAPDLKGHYSNDKTTICVSDQINYLLSLLNSSALWWFIRATAATKQGGFYEFKPMYVGQLPIPSPSRAEQAALEALVDKILAAQGGIGIPACEPTNTQTRMSVAQWEREIDERVYRLYGLTKEEIKIVEESPKSQALTCWC